MKNSRDNILKRSSHLYDQIYEVLWQRILDGTIGPGSKIRDTAWAKLLGVSRTPVREALRKLEHDGLLESQHHGGYKFRQPESCELANLYECRAVLEGLAARGAADKISSAQIDELGKIAKSASDAVDDADYETALERNTRFHQKIIVICGNPYLEKLLSSLRRMILFNRSILLKSAQLSSGSPRHYAEHLESTQRDHQAILNALRNHDAIASETQMREHLFRTAADMQNLLATVDH